MKSGRAGNPSSPSVPKDARDLIRLMSRANPTWGAPRIHGELLKLGMNIGETSVSKYLVHQRKPPSQTWRTILENHVKDLVSVDFFTVPTPAQAIGLEEAGPDRLRPPSRQHQRNLFAT